MSTHSLPEIIELFSQRMEQRLDRIEKLMKEGGTPSEPVPGEKLITRDILCMRLGISKPTVIRMEKKKVITPIRVFGSVRYDWADVLKSLEKQKTRL